MLVLKKILCYNFIITWLIGRKGYNGYAKTEFFQ